MYFFYLNTRLDIQAVLVLIPVSVLNLSKGRIKGWMHFPTWRACFAKWHMFSLATLVVAGSFSTPAQWGGGRVNFQEFFLGRPPNQVCYEPNAYETKSQSVPVRMKFCVQAFFCARRFLKDMLIEDMYTTVQEQHNKQSSLCENLSTLCNVSFWTKLPAQTLPSLRCCYNRQRARSSTGVFFGSSSYAQKLRNLICI